MCSSSSFNGSFCFCTNSIYFKSKFSFDLAITQDLDAISLVDNAVDIKVFRTKLSEAIFLSNMISLSNIDHLVLNTIDVFETTLWYAALNRHLSTFVSHFTFVTCTALSTFVTFCRGTTFTTCFTTANTNRFMRCSFGWS